MRVKAKLKRIDRGRIKIQNLLRSVRDGDSYVKVGLIGSKKSARAGDKLTNVQVAVANEYGTRTIPARPFIRPAFETNRAKYATTLRDLCKTLVQPGTKSYTDALNLLGMRASADFKNYVTTGTQIPPPNAPSTLARKMRRDQANWEAKARKKNVREGPVMAPRTLVDTGRMVNAITHLVVRRSAIDVSNRLMKRSDAIAAMPKPKKRGKK